MSLNKKTDGEGFGKAMKKHFSLAVKIISVILVLVQSLVMNVSFGEMGEKENEPSLPPGTVNDISGHSNLSGSVLMAAEAKNAVQGIFTNPNRSEFKLSNAQVSLTHELNAWLKKTATLTSTGGKVYFENTMNPFYVKKGSSIYRYASASKSNARVNTIRLGEYYYETHIRDLDFSSITKGEFKLDKTYHMYADRLYQEFRLYASHATQDLGSFGVETVIPAKKVNSFQVRDANGIHSTSDFDCSSVEYIAFDIEGAGVAGFIIPSNGSTAKVTLSIKGENYIVRQFAAYEAGTGINKNDETGGYDLNYVAFGSRVWAGEEHSFDAIDKAASLERNPLEDISVTGGGAAFLGYEHLRGTYMLSMPGTHFQDAYDNPDKRFSAPVSITCGNADRDVYIRSNGESGCLEAAALLDSSGRLAAMDVQVCKNFQGDGGEAYYSVKDYQYGDSIFPLALKKNETLNFTLLNLYQNWGNFPLKQLSSIEFHVSYYHLSTGTTESNCIAPYFVYEKDGWVLPDFRGRSGDIWQGQPQFNSVGRLYFAQYQKSIFSKTLSEYTGANIKSSGLSYSDIVYAYTSDCGSYDYSLRHVEFPQTDENRTYYTLNLKFNRDITFKNFKRDFELFTFDGRFVRFQQIDYLNEQNENVTKTLDISKNFTEYITLGKTNPYFGYFDITDEDIEKFAPQNFGANVALLIKNSSVTIGGKKWNGNFAFKNSFGDNMNVGSLTLNETKISFKAGDEINIDMVLLPWGTVSEKTDENVQAVLEDSVKNPITLSIKTGKIVEDAFLPVVQSENNVAEFVLKGGRNNNAVRVTGFTSNECPNISVYKNGDWEPLKISSVHGYDGYTAHYNPADGTYDFSFVYNAEDPHTEYAFRLEY